MNTFMLHTARHALIVLMLFAHGLVGSVSAQILPSFGGDRAGTSGFQFLKIPVDARSAALGQSVVANAFDASALFWNPALAAQTDGFQAGVQHAEYFVDVTLDYAGLIYKLPGSQITLGASIQTLGTDKMNVTTELEPFGTGESFRYLSMATGLTISQQLTDLFSYGVTAKWVRESTAGIETNTAVLDLGIFYRVGTTGIQMAVAVRNFGLDGTPSGELDRVVLEGNGLRTESDFESITPPTTFLLGFTYNVLSGNQDNDLLLAAQLNNPNDNAENWNVGAEYTWNRLLILRTGYRFGISGYTIPSAGVGLNISMLGSELRFDYGFSQLERLGSIHRVGLNLSL